jgi:hypothetical protein
MVEDIDLIEAFVGFAPAQGGEVREVHAKKAGAEEMSKLE